MAHPHYLLYLVILTLYSHSHSIFTFPSQLKMYNSYLSILIHSHSLYSHIYPHLYIQPIFSSLILPLHSTLYFKYIINDYNHKIYSEHNSFSLLIHNSILFHHSTHSLYKLSQILFISKDTIIFPFHSIIPTHICSLLFSISSLHLLFPIHLLFSLFFNILYTSFITLILFLL